MSSGAVSSDEESSFEEKMKVPSKSKRHISSPRSIVTELSKYNFSEQVIIKANQIFMEMKPGIKRRRNRLYLHYACVYYAYLELNTPTDPNDLALKIGIDKKEINTALNKYSATKTQYKQKVNLKINPVVCFLKLFCSNLDLTSDQYNEMVYIYNRISDKIETNNIRLLAGGIISYYCYVNEIKIRNSKIAKVSNVGEIEMKLMKKDVRKYDNC